MRLTPRRQKVAVAVVAALASLAGTVGVTQVHAASVGACEAATTWTIADSLTTSMVNGQVVFPAGECATVNSDGLPFEALTVGTVNGFLTYTYEGTCAEGFMDFTNGDTAIFVGGVVVWERQSSGGALAVVGVQAPSGVPCTGAPGSTMTWSGVIAAAIV